MRNKINLFIYYFALQLFCVIFVGLSFFSHQAIAQTFTANLWDNKTAPGWIYSGSPVIDGTTNTPDGPNALRFIYGTGYDDGSGAEGVAQYDFPDQQDIWFGHWFKYSPSFEWHTIGNKISYIIFNTGGNFFTGVWGSNQGANSLKIVLVNQGAETVNYFSTTG